MLTLGLWRMERPPSHWRQSTCFNLMQKKLRAIFKVWHWKLKAILISQSLDWGHFCKNEKNVCPKYRRIHNHCRTLTCEHFVQNVWIWGDQLFAQWPIVTNRPISQGVTKTTLDKQIHTLWKSQQNVEFCAGPKLRLISLGGRWKFGRLGCQRLDDLDSHQVINYARGGREAEGGQ